MDAEGQGPGGALHPWPAQACKSAMLSAASTCQRRCLDLACPAQHALPPPGGTGPAGEDPQQAYTGHFEEWMVVDPAMVTTTGLECDKIGVSYS